MASPMPPASTGRCQPLEIEDNVHSMLTDPAMYEMRSINAYQIERMVGEGTYGAVYLAHDKATKQKVALKRIKLDQNSEREGFPITSLREIRHLFKIAHPNVVELKEMVYGGKSIKDACELYMVLEYLEHDLLGIQQTLKKSGTNCFSIGDVKCYVDQLLQGLKACHKAGVLHRDLKSANLLVNSQGYLKIADFGLSRKVSGDERLTPKVCTLWYRPPELLMAGHDRLVYGPEVDIWSAGCIFAELLAGRPFFDKNDEIEALYAICRICGSPNPDTWPEVTRLPGWQACRKEFKENRLKKTLMNNVNRMRPKQTDEEKAAIAEAIDLISQMLELNPRNRPSAEDLVQKKFFSSQKPYPTEKSQLAGVNLPDSHALDWESKRQNKQGLQDQGGKGGKAPRNDDGINGGDPGAKDGHYKRPMDLQNPRHPAGGMAAGAAGPRDRYEPYPRGGRGGGAGHGRPGARGDGGGQDRYARDDHRFRGNDRAYDDPAADRGWNGAGSHMPPHQGYGAAQGYGGAGGYGRGYQGSGRYVGDRYEDYDYAGWGGGGAGYYDYDGWPSVNARYGNVPPDRMVYDYDDVGGTNATRPSQSHRPAAQRQ